MNLTTDYPQTVVVATAAGVVAAVNLRNGEILWRQVLPHGGRVHALQLQGRSVVSARHEEHTSLKRQLSQAHETLSGAQQRVLALEEQLDDRCTGRRARGTIHGAGLTW